MILRSAMAAGIEMLVFLLCGEAHPFRDARRPRVRADPDRSGTADP